MWKKSRKSTKVFHVLTKYFVVFHVFGLIFPEIYRYFLICMYVWLYVAYVGYCTEMQNCIAIQCHSTAIQVMQPQLN
jgi:hypothetical protein